MAVRSTRAPRPFYKFGGFLLSALVAAVFLARGGAWWMTLLGCVFLLIATFDFGDWLREVDDWRAWKVEKGAGR